MKLNNKINFLEGFTDKLTISSFALQSGENLYFCVPSEMAKFRVNTLLTKEPSTISWLNRIKENDTFLDVGANIGIYSIYAAVVRKCKVISIEPESQNFSNLVRNIVINNLYDKAVPFCFALTNENKIGSLNLSNFSIDRAGSGHMFDEELAFDLTPRQFVFKQGCIGMTLDKFLDSEYLSVPNFIKIDVDGLEHKIIEGAISTLNNHKVKSILIEIYSKLEEHMNIIDRLVSLGFQYDPDQVEHDRIKDGWNQGMGNIIFNRL